MVMLLHLGTQVKGNDLGTGPYRLYALCGVRDRFVPCPYDEISTSDTVLSQNAEKCINRQLYDNLTLFLIRGFRMAAPLAVGPVRRLPTPPLRSPGSALWLPGFV